MNDRLVALRLFVRVAQTGSFSGAGRELGLSQPSASRIIAHLEQDVGAPLLTRTTRAVTLTEAGALYLDRIEPLLAVLEEADHEARGTGELRGRLRVGLSSSLGIREVIPRLPRLMQRHPELRIELLMDDQRQDLIAEGVDVALRFGALPDPGTSRLVLTSPRVLAASPAYLAGAGTPTAPGDLAAHAIIAGPTGGITGWSFRKDRTVLHPALQSHLAVSVNEGAIAAALAGLGIMSSTLAGCDRELAAGSLLRVLPDWSLGDAQLHAVFPGGQPARPAARAFVDFLLAELRPVAGAGRVQVGV